MKWCVFVDRRCCGEDCVGWIKDNCFIYSLFPTGYSDGQTQTEFDWSKFESMETVDYNLRANSDRQLSFLDELEKLIIQKTSAYKQT